MRYFKKLDPRQQLLLSSGQWFSFPAAGDFGIVATSDEGLIQQLQIAMDSQRGGVSEITEAEYQDLKKNPQFLKRFAPERISPKLLRKLQEFKAGAGRVVDDLASARDEIFKNINQPLPASDYRPGSVKRI